MGSYTVQMNLFTNTKHIIKKRNTIFVPSSWYPHYNYYFCFCFSSKFLPASVIVTVSSDSVLSTCISINLTIIF